MTAIGGVVAGAVHALLTPIPGPGRSAVPQKDWVKVPDDALRFTAPVDFLTRVATRDITVAGAEIRAGEVMLISPLSANHDTAEFGDDADIISPTRHKGVGLAFGAGVHLCVGMRMSRNIIGRSLCRARRHACLAALRALSADRGFHRPHRRQSPCRIRLRPPMDPLKLRETVLQSVAGLAGVAPASITDETNLESLGLDSSDAVVLAMEVEEQTGLEIEVGLFLRCATVAEAATEIVAIAVRAAEGTAAKE